MNQRTNLISRRKLGIFGIYKRKFLAFAIVAIVSYFGVTFYSDRQNIDADEVATSSVSSSKYLNFDIVISERGDLTVNSKASSYKVDVYKNFDELRLPIVDNPKKSYDRVRATVRFPKNPSEVEHSFLGIHGVGSAKSNIEGDNTIVYEASNVASSATLTVVAKMPKDIIKPPLLRQVWAYIESVRGSFWVIVAVSLPALTLLIMLFFLVFQYRRQKIDVPEKEITMPPMALPPAIVGVLFNQRVGSREIASTLIDLALRGNIFIIDQERDFAFGKSRFDSRLLGFEKILLSKIFRSNMKSDMQIIQQRIDNHLYSKKISMVSAGIYALATRLGYFKVNPQKYHAKFRLIGILLFLLAVGGFTVNLLIFSNDEYLILFWVGMMVSALIIAFRAGSLPIRTAIGQEILSNWLAFRKYLTNPAPYPYSVKNQEIFQKYLPYAIVLNCEIAWAKRFSQHNFVVPEWFMTERGNLGLEDFCLSLFPIVSYVGRSLAAIREPGFE